MAPMMASVARVAFTSSDSNQRSRMVARRRGEDLHGPRPVLPELEEPPAGPGEPQEVAGPPGEGIGRRLEQGGLDGARDPLQHRLVGGEARRVARRELRDLAPVELRVGAHEQRPSVGERGEGGRVAGQQLVPVPVELEVADDLRAEQAHHVGGGRYPEAGPGLLGHGRAAHPVPRLEDENVPAGTPQVRGGDEAIVASAHDHRVPGRLRGSANGHGASRKRAPIPLPRAASRKGAARQVPASSFGRVSPPTRVFNSGSPGTKKGDFSRAPSGRRPGIRRVGARRPVVRPMHRERLAFTAALAGRNRRRAP